MAAGHIVLNRKRPIRVVVAKVGLDGHEVGVRVVARGLRDAGMEVIYTGLRRTPEHVVSTALQEDADVLGISFLSGAHVPLARRVRRLMDEYGLDDTLLVVGGIIPDADIEVLSQLGVDAVFHPATRMEEIARYIRTHVQPLEARSS